MYLHFVGLDGFRHLRTVARGSCRPDNDVKIDQTINAKRKLAQVIAFPGVFAVASARPQALAA